MLWANKRFDAAIQTRLANGIMLSVVRAPYTWCLTQNSAALIRFCHSDIFRWSRGFVQHLLTMAQYQVGMVVPLALVLVIAMGADFLSLLVVVAIGFLLARLVQSHIKRIASVSKQATDRLVVVANNALATQLGRDPY